MALLRHRCLLTLLALSTFLAFTSSLSYMVMTPKFFNPGWPLNVVITFSGTYGDSSMKETINVSGDLVGQRYSQTRKTMASGSWSFWPGENKLITLQVPADLEDDFEVFSLNLRGSGAMIFKEDVILLRNYNQSVLMVQTDKNIYKPGQLVRFRVLHLNKDLAPKKQALTVIILNPKGSKLERFDDLESVNGVQERTFELSSYASLGTWSIQLLMGDELLHMNTFLVDEYVLPKFSVEVNPDPDFLVWSIYNLPPAVIVTSKYTYGKAVQGKCVLTIGRSDNGLPAHIITQEIPESGVIEFSKIDWEDIIGDQPVTKRMLIANATVTDIMGRTESEVATINIFRSDYKIEILPASPEVLHSGLETSFYIKLSDHFHQPVAGLEMEVVVSMPDMTEFRAVVSQTEMEAYATVTFTPQWNRVQAEVENIVDKDVTGNIKVWLLSDRLLSATRQLYWFVSEQLENIKIQTPFNMKIERGKPVEFPVWTKSSRLAGSIMAYAVTAQGIIVETGKVENNKITVTPTKAMCPHARLVVYLLLPNVKDQKAEIIADSVALSPNMCIDKKVNVTFDIKQQRTGTDANLQVNVFKTNTNENVDQVHEVFYLAVDKSIVLLQGDTSIDEHRVLTALDQLNTWDDYDNITPYVTASVFDTLGLKIKSSATIQEKLVDRMYYKPSKARSSNDVEDSVNDDSAPPKEASSNSKEPSAVTATKIRKDFPDTWLWGKGNTTDKGQFRTTVRLPDTITSWYVSAFAINQESIAVAAPAFELTAFQPFFLALNLPYSIKRGEVFLLRVTLFNYRPQQVRTVIRIKQSSNFIISGRQIKDGWSEIPVQVFPNLASSVDFEINATTIGRIEFHVVAEDLTDPNQRDEVIRNLIVKSPGEERTEAVTEVMLLVDQNSYTKTFEIVWPSDQIIQGSQRLQLKVTGQVVGQALNNLHSLVVQPTGCGEQNMITLVPNIYGMHYIVETGQRGTDEYTMKMLKNMKSGYMREVDNYRLPDGSYSAWGVKDKKGSSWLTAFVLKSFSAASQFINVDPDVLLSAQIFLLSKQDSEGYFREDGRIIHKQMQAGTSNGISLTVYCLMSLLEMDPDPKGGLDRTVELVLRELPRIKSSTDGQMFLPAITAYALSLLVDSTRFTVTKEVEDILSYIETSGAAPWENEVEKTSHGYGKPTIFMTGAYTLLAYLQLGNLPKSMKVMRWLQSCQNSRGGFGSTQDTVVVLQSLAEYGIFFKNVEATGQVEVSAPNTGISETLDISGERSILLQIIDIPFSAEEILVTLTGETNTLAVVKLVYTYNTPIIELGTSARNIQLPSKEKTVDLLVKSERLSGSMHRVITCVKSSEEKSSGMYVASLTFPTGERPVDSNEIVLSQNPGVMKVETDEDKMHFYIDDVGEEQFCVKAVIEKEVDVIVQQPGSAIFYDYYEPANYKEAALELDKSCLADGCATDATVSITSFLLTICICALISLITCM